MKKYFAEIDTLEELKKAYRKFVFQLHPDKGGDVAEFQKMSNEYDIVFKAIQKNAAGKTNKKQNTEVPETFKNIVNTLIRFEGLEFEIVGSWIWLSGNTYPIKEELKKLNFFWSAGKKKWYNNGDNKKINFRGKKKSMEQLKQEYGCTAFKSQGVKCIG